MSRRNRFTAVIAVAANWAPGTSGSAWPAYLADNTALAAYVSEHSPYEICEEQIKEMYVGCRAALRWTPVTEVQPGPSASNLDDKLRQSDCDRRAPETMPPLLVDEGRIMDGNHRYRSLRKRGVTHCWAYHIEEIPAPAPRASRSRPENEGFCP